MADNVVANSIPVATRSVTYSTDASQNVQAVAPVLVTGADDTKVATDIAPVVAGLDSTGGGIQAVGLVAQLDDAAPAAVTENQFAPVRMSSRRALLVEGVSGGTAVKVDGSAAIPTSSTSTQASVAGSATSVSLLAANAARKMAMLFNDSTAILYVFFGAGAATTSNFTVQLAAGAYYELPQPVFTGELRGIWASAAGNARVTELT